MEDSLKNCNKENIILKRVVIYICFIVIMLTTSIGIITYRAYSKNNLNYSAYINNRLIGYVDNKKDFKESIKSITNGLVDQYPTINIKKYKLSFKKVNKSETTITNDIEVKKNALKSLEGRVNTNRLIINGIEFGYISSEEEKKSALNSLVGKYLKDINVDKDNVLSVNINGSIELKKETVNISSLDPLEIIVERLYETNKGDKPILNIDITLNETVKEAIMPKTTILSTNEIYLGQSKNQEGLPGEKEVLKEVTYSNGKKLNEKNISEKVIVEPKDNIVYKGVKDPIAGGIAFLENPSRGSITSNYGARWGKVHKGIDIAGNIGDPIKAALDGKVIEAYYSSSYGNVITIEHGNGIQTLYAHCSKLLAKEGQEVKRGDIIAKIGNTGRSTGPHLHFELKVNGSAINPIKYID
ncbi:peptidoglycan DD-metalloendopeptidase family protein [Clostridium intestinale]|uniref:peptidoglycan DD-metalloendopeptidase family protein n=1 Tax=Clostridium intestinale TaxID=36845 RepID=UPI0028E5C727|nr:peptidoglycan DD-metalloendopeptidase family protein [Clostridium intestinale]